MQIHWATLTLGIYILVLILVCLRIIYETRSATKTMAYLLLVIFIPVAGILFYLAFGINYWRKKIYRRKMNADETLLRQLQKDILQYNDAMLGRIEDSDDARAELAAMLIRDLQTPLTRHNRVKLLVNGEEKFPEVMKALREAKHHIHIEYYIFETGKTGDALVELLIQKAKEGVEVRLIYDDFGSPNIKKPLEKRMREAGVEVHPFYKIWFYILANRLYYRNHRKIIVIDGKTAFVGGINVSDKYVNDGSKKIFWRDTHLRIDGPGVYYLQYLFMSDWNFCCSDSLIAGEKYFAPYNRYEEDVYCQVVGSGPDSPQPSVMFSLLQAIYLAKEEILITTPYFIPGDSITDALRVAALSGLKVKLLVPGICDSRLVNSASKAYYSDLLLAGVEIYIYNRGFVHAKTLVSDGKLSIIGTANMDNRSFELNFEVNAIIYDSEFSSKLREVFFDDLSYAEKINPDDWFSRSAWEQFPEKIARLLSPSL